MRGLLKSWQQSGLLITSATLTTRSRKAGLPLRCCRNVRGYRGILYAFAGLIIAVYCQPVSGNATSKLATEQGKRDAAKDINIAAGVSRIESALEAPNAKTDPYEKDRNEREVRDLQAQEKSAYWAEWMFYATAVAVVISLIGIFLVFTTFRATRRSNDIARDAQRPWIAVKTALTGSITCKGGILTIPVSVEARNQGQSAATGVHIFALPYLHRGGKTVDASYLDHVKEFSQKAATGLVLHPSETTKKPFIIKIDIEDFMPSHRAPCPVMIVSIVYRSVLEPEKPLHSGKGFVLSRKVRGRRASFDSAQLTYAVATIDVSEAYGFARAT